MWCSFMKLVRKCYWAVRAIIVACMRTWRPLLTGHLVVLCFYFQKRLWHVMLILKLLHTLKVTEFCHLFCSLVFWFFHFFNSFQYCVLSLYKLRRSFMSNKLSTYRIKALLQTCKLFVIFLRRFLNFWMISVGS